MQLEQVKAHTDISGFEMMDKVTKEAVNIVNLGLQRNYWEVKNFEDTDRWQELQVCIYGWHQWTKEHMFKILQKIQEKKLKKYFTICKFALL